MARAGRRNEIVEAAIAVMARDGAAGLSAAAVARQAGVSKANLFHHFPSLDDIVLEAFERFILEMDSLVRPPPGSLREWLEALGEEALAAVAAQPDLSGAYFAFVARAQSEPRLKARVEAIMVATEAAFARIIAQLAPEMDRASVDALATLVLLAGDGMVIHRDLFPGRAEKQRAAWRAFVALAAGKETS